MAKAQAVKDEYVSHAEKIVSKMPKAIRDKAEVETGKGKYALIKYGGRTVASVRSKNVRITLGHDGTAASLAELAGTVAAAAESRPPLKTKEEREAEKEQKRKEREEAKAKKEAEKEAKQKEKEEAEAKAEAEAEAEQQGEDES